MTPSPSRRVIPLGYKVCKLSLHGESPLLMSSGEADRDSDTYIAYRQLSKQRTKSVEDEDRLRELEWHTRLYFDEELGPYIPGKNSRHRCWKRRLGGARARTLSARSSFPTTASLSSTTARAPSRNCGRAGSATRQWSRTRVQEVAASHARGRASITGISNARSPSTRSTFTCRCSSPSSNGPRSTVSVITVPNSERSALISNWYASGARMRTRMPSSRAIAKPRRRTRRMWKGSSQQLRRG